MFALPFIGVAQVAAYRRFAPEDRGTAGAIAAMTEGAPIGRRIAPLVVLGTWLTHLGGGSAGREGTAVGMGVSLAETFRRVVPDPRRLAAIGGAAGFAGVFGTPLAAIVFVMEAGRSRDRDTVLLTALAALVSDRSVRSLGVGHVAYPSVSFSFDLGPTVLVGVAAGAVAWGFVAALGGMRTVRERFGESPTVFAAGLLVVIATLLLGTRAYNGLSTPQLLAAFAGGVPTGAFLIKAALTVLTAGGGFRGGEVTPLLVIGGTLGATVARLTGGAGPPLVAAGMVAVYGIAARVPVTAIVLALELLGPGAVVPATLAVGTAFGLTKLVRPND